VTISIVTAAATSIAAKFLSLLSSVSQSLRRFADVVFPAGQAFALHYEKTPARPKYP
jgi:hypothetical protein